MPVASVVIPAHNEEAVILRCLRTLLASVPEGALEIVVAANGCSDATAATASSAGLPVTVLDLPEPGKVNAMRVADEHATVFPRFYLDADVTVPGASLLEVARRLDEQSGQPDASRVRVARPPMRYDASGSSRLVCRYYAARSRVPELTEAMWGAGLYGLTAEGHARITPWPAVIGDDLYVDRCFPREQTAVYECEPVVVRVPRTASALLAILGRNFDGKVQAESDPTEAAPQQSFARTARGLVRLALRRPRTAPDVVVYIGFALAARRRRSAAPRWARDESSRAGGVAG